MSARTVLAAALSVAIAFAAAPAFAGSDEKIAIRHTCKPGEKLKLVYHIAKKQEGMGAEMGLVTQLDIRLAADGKDKADAIGMKFRRILTTLTGTGMNETVIDSDRPETVQSGMPLVPLTQATFTAKLADDGSVEKIDGVTEFLKKAGKLPKDPADAATMEKNVSAGFRQLLEEPFVYLPPEPVAVGDTWKLKRTLHGLPLGGKQEAYDESLTCTLKEVRDTKAGKIAVITAVGANTLTTAPEMLDPESLAKEVTVAYNIDTGELAEHHVVLKGTRDLGDGNAADTTIVIDTHIEKDTD